MIAACFALFVLPNTVWKQARFAYQGWTCCVWGGESNRQWFVRLPPHWDFFYIATLIKISSASLVWCLLARSRQVKDAPLKDLCRAPLLLQAERAVQIPTGRAARQLWWGTTAGCKAVSGVEGWVRVTSQWLNGRKQPWTFQCPSALLVFYVSLSQMPRCCSARELFWQLKLCTPEAQVCLPSQSTLWWQPTLGCISLVC